MAGFAFGRFRLRGVACPTAVAFIASLWCGLAVEVPSASAQCLAANQWAWGSCGGRGGGSRGGGGGGNYAAAAAAGIAAVGFLGALIEQAEAAQRAEQNAANDAARRRAAFCNAKYKRSYALNEEAKATMGSDPLGAYEKFEAALKNLGDCGARSDLAKLRGNLDNARTSYAALIRPSEAKGVYGGDAPTRPNHSAQQLMAAARQQCAHLEEATGGWHLCIRRRMAQTIFSIDRDARNVCQGVANEDERLQCALNQYFAGLYGNDPKRFGDSSLCYFDEHGRSCNGRPIKAAATARPNPRDKESGMPRDEGLRDKLRDAIAKLPDTIPQSKIDQARDAEIARAKEVANSLPPDSPERKHLEQVIAKAEADRAAEAGGKPAEEQKQAATDPKENEKKAEEEYGIDAQRRRAAEAKKKKEEEIVSNQQQSGSHSSQATNDGKLDMRNPGAGVPEKGKSFADEFGGAGVSGGPVPSNR